MQRRGDAAVLAVQRSYCSIPAHVFQHSVSIHAIPPVVPGRMWRERFSNSLAGVTERSNGSGLLSFASARWHRQTLVGRGWEQKAIRPVIRR